MLITFKHQQYTIDELVNGKIKENNFSDHELYVINILIDWSRGKKFFEMNTSGSTGQPKTVRLSRETLTYSAKESLKFLFDRREIKSSLLCINPKYIGGFMVVIRALVSHSDLTVLEPTAHLQNHLDQNKHDLISMVPLQLQRLIDNDFQNLNGTTVLLGGAPLDKRYYESVLSLNGNVYQTYGMTETASHVALKNLTQKSNLYSFIGDIEADVDHRSCLKLKGTVTEHQWLQTNDVVDLEKDGFKWKGRADNVINSGGVKISPELLEEKLSDQIKSTFFVHKLPDSHLGERVVLLVEGDYLPELDFGKLEKYHRPKEVIMLSKFKYTPSGKVDRSGTMKLI